MDSFFSFSKLKQWALLFLGTAPAFVTAQWDPSPSNIILQDFRVYSIKVAPDRSVWAFSHNPDLAVFPTTSPSVSRSVDDGQSWQTSFVDSAFSSRGWDISPLDSLTAYIASADAGLLRTSDGAQTWETMSSYPYSAEYVHFFSPEDGVVFGRAGASSATFGISCTADSGNSWTHIGYGVGIPPGTSIPATSRTFSWSYSVNSSYDVVGDTMIVGRQDGSVWKSEDKGYNWVQVITPLDSRGIRVTNVAMKDGHTFMVVGDINSFSLTDRPTENYTTYDGGQSWSQVGWSDLTAAVTTYLPGSKGTFLMSGHVDFGFGGVGTAVTHDFGATWDLVDDYAILAMDFLDDSTGYGTWGNFPSSGVNGEVHKWNGDSLWLSCELYNDPIIVSGDLLFVSVTEGQLQWLNCDDGYSAIPGANSFSYSPDSAGSYAVELRVGRCIDTVDCVSFQGTTSLGEEVSSFVSLYPNPTKNDLHLSFTDQIPGDLEVEIFDLQGRRQMYQVIRQPGEQATLSLSHLASGYYQVQLTANDQVQRLKLVKQ